MSNCFENCLISCCAPTLAGVKPSNLFAYKATKQENKKLLHKWNSELSKKGIKIETLKQNQDKNLILVYRQSQLQKILNDNATVMFLEQFGYINCNEIKNYLSILRKKIANSDCFPHEIGIFLGYPLHDVKGFIDNKGENATFCGCWKVYGNEQEATHKFMQFAKCKSIYKQMVIKGKTISQLTTAS